MTGEGMGREEIVALVRGAAEALGVASITKRQFRAHTGVTEAQLRRHFDSWTEAVVAAGQAPLRRVRISDEALFRNMGETFEQTGPVFTSQAFGRRSRICGDVYRRRFGTWHDALQAFRRWLEETGEAFPFRELIPGEEAPRRGPRPERRRAEGPHAKTQRREETSPELQIENCNAQRAPKNANWSGGRRAAYGEVLNYRQMLHAPVNEQGVVLLFGMVCGELGFMIEAVRTGYPDCEAKRRAGKRGEGWERVLIEFEYRSSSFREAAHDPEGCDLVVCWVHDWEGCPVEVLALGDQVKSKK